MNIIAWIVIGLVAGAIAKAILPGDDPGGIIVTTLIGIVGAVLGGFIAAQLFNVDTGRFDFKTLLVAIAGSILLLLIYRLVTGNRGGAARGT